VLHQVIAEHLEPFLRAVAEAGDGVGLPQFVECEFRDFLLCGVFEAFSAGAGGATICGRFRAKAAASARTAEAGG
jgi:hypothetical protein